MQALQVPGTRVGISAYFGSTFSEVAFVNCTGMDKHNWVGHYPHRKLFYKRVCTNTSYRCVIRRLLSRVMPLTTNLHAMPVDLTSAPPDTQHPQKSFHSTSLSNMVFQDNVHVPSRRDPMAALDGNDDGSDKDRDRRSEQTEHGVHPSTAPAFDEKENMHPVCQLFVAFWFFFSIPPKQSTEQEPPNPYAVVVRKYADVLNLVRPRFQSSFGTHGCIYKQVTGRLLGSTVRTSPTASNAVPSATAARRPFREIPTNSASAGPSTSMQKQTVSFSLPREPSSRRENCKFEMFSLQCLRSAD